MNKTTRRISVEVKKDILKRVKEQGIPVSQAAKEHGVHESTIYNWLGAGIKSAPTWAEVSKLQKHNKELLELVGELTVRLFSTQKKSWWSKNQLLTKLCWPNSLVLPGPVCITFPERKNRTGN